MQRHNLFIAPALALALFATAAEAQEEENEPTLAAALDAELGVAGGLTADEAVSRALARHNEVRIKQAEVLAAAARVDEALIGYAPELSLVAQYTRLSDESGGSAGTLVAAPGAPEGPIAPGTQLVNAPLAFNTPLNQYSFQASLRVPLSDYVLRIPKAHSAAKASHRAAELSARATEHKARADVRLAYYGWVHDRLQAVVADQAVGAARAHVTDAKHALEVGHARPSDVLSAESRLGSAELWAERTHELAGVSEVRLRRLMRLRSGAELTIGENVLLDPAPLSLSRKKGALTREALRRRPELRALAAHRRALEEQSSLAEAGYYPRLDGIAGTTYANPNSRVFPQEAEFRSSWEVGLRMSWTINDIPKSRVKVVIANADLNELDAERDRLADAIRDEVYTARSSLREAQAAVRIGKRRLKAAEEAYRVRRVLYREGATTLTELTEADTQLTQARLDFITAHIDRRIARVRLLHALGRNR